MSFPQRRRRAATVLFAVFAGLLAGCSDDDRSEPLLTIEQRAGTVCLTFEDDPPLEVEVLPEIDCAEPHSHEIYQVLDYVDVVAASGSDVTDVYPGIEALETFARAECLARFQDFVGISPLDSEMFYSWILPTLNSWEEAEDREVLCVAANRDGSDLAPGSIEGTRR